MNSVGSSVLPKCLPAFPLPLLPFFLVLSSSSCPLPAEPVSLGQDRITYGIAMLIFICAVGMNHLLFSSSLLKLQDLPNTNPINMK